MVHPAADQKVGAGDRPLLALDLPVLAGAGDSGGSCGGLLPGGLLGVDRNILKEVRKMGVREIPTLIPEDEFQGFLDELAEEVQIWKEKDHMGYVSITCDLAKKLTLSAGTDREQVFTASQIKRILDLAK